MPFIFKHVAVMPDCHYGKGATVGTVLATKGSHHSRGGRRRHRLRDGRRKDAADARRHHGSGGHPRGDRAAHSDERRQQQSIAQRKRVATGEGARVARHARLQRDRPNWKLQLGTLGGGNHFIELATDESNTVWATLHSGSRGIGNKIGNLHIRRAQAIAKAKVLICPTGTSPI